MVNNNCVIVSYTFTSEFKCPYNLYDVFEYYVRHDKLHVIVKKGDEEEIFEPLSDWYDNVSVNKPEEVDIVNEEEIQSDNESEEEET